MKPGIKARGKGKQPITPKSPFSPTSPLGGAGSFFPGGRGSGRGVAEGKLRLEDLQSIVAEELAARLGSPTSDDGTEDGDLSNIMLSVVKIYCNSIRPNFSMPWQRQRAQESTSSGFIIDGKRILCNAHGVANHNVVRVRKHGGSHKYLAKVLHVGHECDLALLTIEDDAFWENLEPLKLGKVPRIRDQVIVVGYPTGGDNISVTQGIVSRVGMGTYAHSGEDLLTVQIDAAINSGNSGGPALKDGVVCGVAFESLDDADNIGYIIPCPVVEHFLESVKRMKKTKSDESRICAIDFETQPIESLAMRRALKIPEAIKEQGILITKVPKGSSAFNLLKDDDVLMAFDGVPVGSDGTVPFRGDERLTFDYLVSKKFIGDKATVSVLRDGIAMDVTFTLNPRSPLVPILLYDQLPSYFVYSGILFTKLTLPFLVSEFGMSWDRQAHLRMVDKVLHGEKTPEEEEVVIFAHVFMAPPTIGYEDAGPEIVKKVNGIKIRSMKHLIETVLECKEEYLRFDLEGEGDRTVVILDRKETFEAHAKILKDNNIPSAASPDLEPLIAGKLPVPKQGAAAEEKASAAASTEDESSPDPARIPRSRKFSVDGPGKPQIHSDV